AVSPLHRATPRGERTALLRLLRQRFREIHRLDGHNHPRRVDAPPGSPREDHPVAYLLATGGSTGVPKISARPGPLAYGPARTPSLVIRQTGWRSGQRQLIVGPLYHAAPFTSLLDALLDRNTVVLQPFFAPEWTVELIERYA